MNDTVDIDKIIFRAKAVKRLKKDKELAELLNISANDFSNRKKRGTLFPLLIEGMINEGVNLHWLITGNEAPKALSLDVDLMEKIIETIETWTRESGTDWPPYKKSKIINLLYRMHARSQSLPFNEEAVKHFLPSLS